MSEQCNCCRFWQPVSNDGDCPVEGPGFGWCRRKPPKIIDHMARIAIRTPGFGGHAIDPEDVADVSTVYTASMFPATFRDGWCGRFERMEAGS